MGSTRARIAIDAMGGDHAPAEIVTGTAGTGGTGCRSVAGRPQQIEAALQRTLSGQLEIVPSEGTIEMHEG